MRIQENLGYNYNYSKREDNVNVKAVVTTDKKTAGTKDEPDEGLSEGDEKEAGETLGANVDVSI